jgi:hypothetical protein
MAKIDGCACLRSTRRQPATTAIHLDGTTIRILVPFRRSFDRVSIEVMRGCTQGCCFCQAGYIYRPLESDPREIMQMTLQARRGRGMKRSRSAVEYGSALLILSARSWKLAGEGLASPSCGLSPEPFSAWPRRSDGSKLVNIALRPKPATSKGDQ